MVCGEKADRECYGTIKGLKIGFCCKHSEEDIQANSFSCDSGIVAKEITAEAQV